MTITITSKSEFVGSIRLILQQKHITLRPKNLSAMCFFCAYFISGGTLSDMPLLKRLRLVSQYSKSLCDKPKELAEEHDKCHLYFNSQLCYNVKAFYIFVEARFMMKANYKKLWHILLGRNMKKRELAELAEGGSTYTIKQIYAASGTKEEGEFYNNRIRLSNPLQKNK